MPDIGVFHPQIVHFAVALLFAGVFARWVSLTGKLPWIGPGATALLLAGALALGGRPGVRQGLLVASGVVGLAGGVALFEAAEHGGDIVYSYAGGVGIR